MSVDHQVHWTCMCTANMSTDDIIELKAVADQYEATTPSDINKFIVPSACGW